MGLTIYQVDAFASRPFAGNPAAVCLMKEPADEGWMQSVAMEMNLAETAFLHPEGDDFRLRWFTPTKEVALCGHATLASAHILYEQGHLWLNQQARFRTLSGLLTANRHTEGIELDFPAEPEQSVLPPADLITALGVSPKYVGRNRLDYLVEVDSEETLRAVNPDFRRLATVEARGVIVTSRAEKSAYDFVSRYFAPAFGIDEDPVTGSAHCCLGPFWAKRLDKRELVGYQASARGGVVRVRVDESRVGLIGRSVTVLRAELFPDAPDF
jgi:PhzF family phenazine biosynthesis protein